MASQASPAVDLSPRPVQPRATHVRYVVMAFLCVLAFLTYFDRVCIASAQGDISRDLGLSNQQMGLILGGFWLAYGLFEIPSGWLGDRFGSRRTLSRIVLAWSLFTALSGSAAGFTSLFLYRFLFGVGEAGAFPNMARVQNAWFPVRAQGRVGGVLWLIARWGGALSYVIFPSMMAAIDSPTFRSFLAHMPGLSAFSNTPSWRIAFWISGSIGLDWVVLFFWWFRDDPARKAGVNEAELDLIHRDRTAEALATHHRAGSKIWAALFSSPSLWAVAMAYMCSSFVWSFFVSWMPKYMNDRFHPSPNDLHWMNTGPLLVGGAACLLGGWLSDRMVRVTGRLRLGRVIFPIVGLAIFGASMFCIRYVHSARAAVALMCLASFGNDLGQAAAWATTIGIGGVFAGTAFGFINTTANAGGNFLQPVVAAYIFPRYGWKPLFNLYTIVLAAGCALWFIPDPTRRFYSDQLDDENMGNHGDTEARR